MTTGLGMPGTGTGEDLGSSQGEEGTIHNIDNRCDRGPVDLNLVRKAVLRTPELQETRS